MVTVLKDNPIDGVEVVPCRLEGPRGVVKAFMAHDDGSLVVIDTGFNDADTDRLVARLEKIGRSPSDISACVITHRHGDHVGGLKKLRSLADFPVVSHVDEAAGIEATCGVKVDRVVRDGDVLDEAGGIQVVHMPGHTPGSIALYITRSRSLAVGDAILSGGEHLFVSPQYLCADPAQAQESVRRLLSMNLAIDNLLVAHGDDVYRDAARPLGRIFAGPRLD